ncbi:glycoside hydrolase family 31 protein [Mariniphaga sediminis]|uniref:glycoside hydrolase family 31 protein n=1 Tax=Mariniphaga sediminis TaxID=1628158 RepID=UPI003565B51A
MKTIILKNIGLISLVCILCCSVSKLSAKSKDQIKKIDIAKEESVWAGIINDGHLMPLQDGYQMDFYSNNKLNQLQPLILTSKGQFVWSEEPFYFEITDSEIIITDSNNSVITGKKGSTLAEVQEYVRQTYFPASGKIPDTLLFVRPQYNTWIELTYNQNQADILNYARSILDNGLPAGVLMIDDTWQEDYGLWKFHPGRFPDPKKMVEELHAMGFKVMLWVCPFVSADQTLLYSELKKSKAFLLENSPKANTWEKASKPLMVEWWNGQSALLDFSNPAAVKWFNSQLEGLVNDYGIDGFKFDAGDTNFYPANSLSKGGLTPNEHCLSYTQFGLNYPLNEYRACWKMGGQPFAQRLLDKGHSWEDLKKLIPNMVIEALSGYTFSCPDMIGGGLWTSFLNDATINQELIVRSAQCHALMPMMQFSVAPWRVLNKKNLEAVKKATDIRKQFIPLIMDLAKESVETGAPIMVNLEYYFPNQGLAEVNDQFMLGDKVMVAPMVNTGNKRSVIFPKGKWKADDDKVYKGGKTYEIDVPYNRLPYFQRIKK